jgi:hypothetical protein
LRDLRERFRFEGWGGGWMQGNARVESLDLRRFEKRGLDVRRFERFEREV